MVVKATVLNDNNRVWQRNSKENYEEISFFDCHIYNLAEVLLNVACVNKAGNRKITYLSL